MGAAARHRRSFIAKHKLCAFCGGERSATTVEHCPPRAMFQHRLWPEGFEFPACEECNKGSDDQDFLIAMLARMNPFESTENADGKLNGLMLMANKQHPGLLQKMMPSANEARRHNRKLRVNPLPGQTQQETGIVKVPEEIHQAVCVLARKLAKGVFYRETGIVFPDCGCLFLNWFTNADFVRDGKYIVFDLMKDIGGVAPPMQRSGKYLGDQFEYKLSLAPEKNVFIIQARFGGAFGFVVFGSTVPDLLESRIVGLREKSAKSGPFEILQSPTLA